VITFVLNKKEYTRRMEKFELPSTYYRVSCKALILDETRTKFAVVLEDTGFWDLPGGGIDHGESPSECLKREIKEEVGLIVTEVNLLPSYFLVGKNTKNRWSVNVVFEVKVKDFNFILSSECRDFKFISLNEVDSINTFRTVKELAAQFDSKKHK
jgi:8-oxo-dGTP pyrophosphatase MutT (NUDIX family)